MLSKSALADITALADIFDEVYGPLGFRFVWAHPGSDRGRLSKQVGDRIYYSSVVSEVDLRCALSVGGLISRLVDEIEQRLYQAGPVPGWMF